MRKPVIFVCGSDAIKGPGGHQTLVRATARAARNAGFDPRVFCAARKSSVVEADFGVVHYVASPFRTVRNTTARLHMGFISSGIRQFLKDRTGPHSLHGFGIWGWAAIDVSKKLQRAGVPATAIISVYDTIDHETSAPVRRLAPANGWRKRLRSQRRFMWTRLIMRRTERYAFTRARLLMMNYESVRRLIRDSYGDDLELRIMPYSSETAFVNSGGAHTGSSAAPEPIVALPNQDAPLI
ncbi:MAG TPA: hypothetical protein VI756_20200, partial [Blastocatellia bacterium]